MTLVRHLNSTNQKQRNKKLPNRKKTKRSPKKKVFFDTYKMFYIIEKMIDLFDAEDDDNVQNENVVAPVKEVKEDSDDDDLLGLDLFDQEV